MRINCLSLYNCNPVKNKKSSKSNPKQINFGFKIDPANIKNDEHIHSLLGEINKFIHHLHKKTILKTIDGKELPAEIVKPQRTSWHIKCNDKTVGTILLSKSDAPIKGDNYPDYYKDKTYLFINSLNSQRTYKGIGTALVKEVIEESKRLGLEGRVCLNTTTTKKEIGSPVPFYYKLGFRCSNSENQKIIDECIKEGKPIPAECEAVTMFLPKEIYQYQ